MENEDQKRVVECVKTISDEHWRDQQSPILLSALAPRLETVYPGYREVLGVRTLKAFIKETGAAAGYELFEHPIQHARVGVAPVGASYEFPSELTTHSATIPARGTHESTLAFLRALATLPSGDLDKVVIPVSVLVKLLK